MKRLMCLNKMRKDENNQIIGYTLFDETGAIMSVTTDRLKQLIKDGKIEVTNLVITSNNGSIDIE